MLEPIVQWWDKQHSDGIVQSLTGSSGKQEWVQLVVEELIHHGIYVLNIGVGTGAGTKDLYNAGCVVDVLDISSVALKKVTDTSRHQYLDVAELPSNTYDLALSFLVAQHVSHDSLRAQLSNVIRSLKPSGIFAIQAPCSIYDIELGDDSICSQQAGVVVRSPEAFSAMVKDAGGTIDKQVSAAIFPDYSFEWTTYHIRHA